MGFHAVGTFAARQPAISSRPPIDSIEGQKFLAAFDELCAQRRDDVAVGNGSSGVTYRQLMQRSNDIATAIHALGPYARSRIAVLAEPSADLVASMLAIRRLGCTYIPLEVNMPKTQLATILEISRARTLLHTASTSQQAKDYFVPYVLDVSALPPTKEQVPEVAQIDSAPFTHSADATQSQSLISGMSITQVLNALFKGEKLVVSLQGARDDLGRTVVRPCL